MRAMRPGAGFYWMEAHLVEPDAMPPLTRVVSELQRLAEPPESDTELLDRFVRSRDQEAFTALVERHGPMVLRLCRRVLGDAHAAEDVLQATFLKLAQKAASLPRPAGLASWLYTVAQHIAFKVRRANRRLRRDPLHAEPADSSGDPLSALTARELLVVLEEELQRLPAAHRMAVVACCLEGHSRDDAAALLGCSVGALRGWLERGRARLHTRLLKRGITLTAALAAAEAAHGSVDAALLASATHAALGTASVAVARLAGGGAWMWPSLMLAAALVLGGAALSLMRASAPVAEEQQAAQPALQAPAADMIANPLPPDAIARIGSPRLRHASAVNTAVYSPDGKSIVTFDEDGQLCFWNAATGAGERRLRPSKGAGWGRFAFQSDGKNLVLFDGREVQTIDVASGKPSRSFSTRLSPPIAYYSSFDRTGSVLAFHRDNTLFVIDVAAGKERFRRSGDTEFIHSAAVRPDGKCVAMLLDSGSILLLDAMTGKVQRRLEGFRGAIGPLVFAPDGKQLIAIDGNPLICDVETGKIVGKIKYGTFSNHRRCAAFSPDGKRVAFSGSDVIVVAEAPGGKEIRRLPVRLASSLAFAADNLALLVGAHGGDISQWDVTTGRLLDASANPFPQAQRLQFLDDRGLHVLARAFQLWDARAGTLLKQFPALDDGLWRAADVSRDGSWLAYLSANGALRLVDTQRPDTPRAWRDRAGGYLAVRFAPDGRTLFATAQDHKLRGWDLASGELRHEWDDTGALRNVLIVSPDGRWVLTASTMHHGKPDTVARIWDLRAKRLAHTISLDDLHLLTFAFSADGTRLAAAGGAPATPNAPGTITVFDTATGQRLTIITHPRGPVTTLAFTPDARCLATADHYGEKPGTFHYWEVATQQERHHFEGHLGRVRALAFSPGGALLAAASPEAPVYVWDIYGRHTGQPPSPGAWTAKERERLWTALSSPDATTGFGALRQLIRAPGPAVVLIRERLKPAEPVDLQRAKRWLAELDDTDFAVRQSAFDSLEQHGDRIEAMLQQALTSKRSLEAKRRIESLLTKGIAPNADNLGRGRALEALEQIATQDAVRLLDALAAGEPSARLTREAAAARKRLDRSTRR